MGFNSGFKGLMFSDP